uniref:Uncharacterized protein n=1 Tax=Phaeomonas parva TaxID=124430 RepID=A0A7S1TRX5_9STRA|mmetsp:Transcript_14067/g.42059  ORF Transcript_14067/g.42059 Transcript_14067/m.42059 type:complete len:364 (+) Transcript_14067:273-1364(+)
MALTSRRRPRLAGMALLMLGSAAAWGPPLPFGLKAGAAAAGAGKAKTSKPPAPPGLSRREIASYIASFTMGAVVPAVAQDMRSADERQYELYVAAMQCESVADLEGAEKTWSRLIDASVMSPVKVSGASKTVLARAYSGRSRVRAGLGKLPPALVDISAAVGLEPDIAEFWAQRGAVFEAASRELHASGEMAKAKQLFQSACSDYDHGLMLDPNNAALHERSGDVKVLLEDYVGALQSYMHGLENAPAPGNTALAVKFALVVVQTGDDAMGARILSEILEEDGGMNASEDVMLASAAVAWSAGNYAEAMTLYKAALQQNHTLADTEGAVAALGWPPRSLELLKDLKANRTNFDALMTAPSGFL